MKTATGKIISWLLTLGILMSVVSVSAIPVRAESQIKIKKVEIISKEPVKAYEHAKVHVYVDTGSIDIDEVNLLISLCRVTSDGDTKEYRMSAAGSCYDKTTGAFDASCYVNADTPEGEYYIDYVYANSSDANVYVGYNDESGIIPKDTIKIQTGYTDFEAPVISKVEVPTNSVREGEQITVRVHATDQGSGISENHPGVVQLEPIGAIESIGRQRTENLERIQDGVYEASFSVDDTWAAGDYQLTVVRVYDAQNNSSAVKSDDKNSLIPNVIIHADTSYTDFIPPSVTKIEIPKSETLKVGDSFEILIYASDDESGLSDSPGWLEIERIRAENENYSSHTEQLEKVSDGIYRASFHITDEWYAGEYVFEELYFHDERGNYVYIYPDDECIDQPKRSFLVDTPLDDLIPPVIDRMEMEEKTVKPGEIIEVLIYATDNKKIDDDVPGSICFGWSYFDYHFTAETLEKVDEGIYKAYVNTSGWEPGEYRLTHVNIRDACGNSTYKLDPAHTTVTIEGSNQLEILSQPRNINTAVGKPVFFMVGASGSELSYQWYYKKAGAASWSIWKGHTEPTTWADANDTWEGMQVYCKVTDGDGRTVDSQPATISVTNDDTLRIVKHPGDVLTSNGTLTKFAVTATGVGLTYQWYYKKSGTSDWSKWNGHTTANTSAVSNETWEGMQVYCKVTDANGESVSSNPATIYLSYNDELNITQQPENITTEVGKSTAFSVIATGRGLTYQWYYKKANASDWSIWKNHTTATTYADANATWDGMKVFCKVTDEYGDVLKSDAATITIIQDAAFRITSQPQDTLTAVGKNTKFTVAATGMNLKYQWYYKKTGVHSWSIWKNHTTATTSADANDTWDGMQVYCKVTDGSGKTLDSQPATITIEAEDTLAIIAQPQDVTTQSGKSTKFSIAATGKDLSYQWYYKKSGILKWSIWKNHTTSTTYADANDSWDGMKVYCKVTDSSGNSIDSDPATVTIK